MELQIAFDLTDIDKALNIAQEICYHGQIF